MRKLSRSASRRSPLGMWPVTLWLFGLIACSGGDPSDGDEPGSNHPPDLANGGTNIVTNSAGGTFDSGAGGTVAYSSGGVGVLGAGGAASSDGGGGAAANFGTGGSAAGGSTGSGGSPSSLPFTIWLAGDSTVANGSTPCPRGWGRSFDSKFNEQVTVVNSAAGGSSVRTWMYSVTATMGPDDECVVNLIGNEPVLQDRWSNMQDLMAAGDYLFIQFGINDGSKTCSRHVGLATFKEEYARMAQIARARGATPVFLTPASSIKCSGSAAVGTRGAFVTATLEVGESENVPVIDLHQRSVDLYNKLNFCPLPAGNSDLNATTGGDVGEFFCDDHTHFSDSGQSLIADLVMDGIADLGLPLAGYAL